MGQLKGILLLMILFSLSCKEKEIDPLGPSARQKALRSIGYDLIVPSFITLQTASNKLLLETMKYRANPTDHQQLIVLKDAWLNCMIACKHARVFRFAPRELEVTFASLNEPPDTAAIDALLLRTESQKIDSTLISALIRGYKGLVAYEYVLFGNSKGDNHLIIKQFENYDQGIRRLDYLLSIAKVLHASSNRIVQKWSIGGDGYVREFVQADGPGTNGSVGLLYEALDWQIDLVRAERIGKPLGVFDNSKPQPNHVDGKWSNYSKFLLEADIDAITVTYKGAYPDRSSFYALVQSGGARVGKTSLAADIDSKLLQISAMLNEITGPIDVMIAESPERINKLYEELEALSRLFKSDVPVTLGL